MKILAYSLCIMVFILGAGMVAKLSPEIAIGISLMLVGYSAAAAIITGGKK